MATATFGPHIQSAYIYGFPADPAMNRPAPPFPEEGIQVKAQDEIPGVIAETLQGSWKAVLIVHARPLPGKNGSNQQIIYSTAIDETPRAEAIKRERILRRGQGI